MGAEFGRHFGLRVVFAEDNEPSRKIGSEILRNYGCHVFPAANGLEALQALTEHESDIVLLDIEMPVCDGYEAVRRIRSGEAGNHKSAIPVIAVSAHSPDEIKDQCKAAGFNGFVSKPISHDSFEKIIVTLEKHARCC